MKLRIRDVRESKKLTIEHVANLMGVSIPHLSEMERGIKNINFHQLAKLKDIYDVPVWELFQFEKGSDEESLAENFGQLNLNNKNAVKNLASELLKGQS